MDEIFHEHHQHFSLLPIDQRKWIPEQDVAYFISEAVKLIPVDRFEIQTDPNLESLSPHALLSLLMFSYSNDIYSSNRIELLAHNDIRFRYVCGYTHPTSDAIYAFRRNNIDAFSESFLTVLMLASELKIPVLGNLPIEDIRTKVAASTKGGKESSLRAMMREELHIHVEDMVQEAERVDNDGGKDIGQQNLPSELTQGSNFREQLAAAYEAVKKSNK